MVHPNADSIEHEPQATPDALKIQILATEHWGLLATRSMTWNEMLARAGMFITVLSASIVSMALVAQATGFDDSFLVFSALVLSVTLLLGIGTMIRLGDALEEDIWLVQAMNRLRHAYLQVAPDLERWFSMGHHDDVAGILLSVGPNRRIGGPGRILSAIAATIAVLNCLLIGVIVTLLTRLATDNATASVAAGLVTTLVAGFFALAVLPMRQIRRGMALLNPRFPTPTSTTGSEILPGEPDPLH